MLGQTGVARNIASLRKGWSDAIQLRVASTSPVLGSMKAVRVMGMIQGLN